MYLEIQTYIRIDTEQDDPYSRLKSRACGTYFVNLLVIGGIHRFRKMYGAVDQLHIAAGRFCTGRCAISCHIGGQPVMDLLPSCKERSILR